ncbi:MAG: hypothetical protein ABI837_16680 [Acidobacteriota bacterium]
MITEPFEPALHDPRRVAVAMEYLELRRGDMERLHEVNASIVDARLPKATVT